MTIDQSENALSELASSLMNEITTLNEASSLADKKVSRTKALRLVRKLAISLENPYTVPFTNFLVNL